MEIRLCDGSAKLRKFFHPLRAGLDRATDGRGPSAIFARQILAAAGILRAE